MQYAWSTQEVSGLRLAVRTSQDVYSRRMQKCDTGSQQTQWVSDLLTVCRDSSAAQDKSERQTKAHSLLCTSLAGTATCTEQNPLSAYVHLPFCKRRCYYCDFPVQAVGPQPDAGPVQNAMQQYIDLLCQEIRSTTPTGGQQLQTVFFGGGTPSLIPPTMLQQVLEALADQFGWVCILASVNFSWALQISGEIRNPNQHSAACAACQ